MEGEKVGREGIEECRVEGKTYCSSASSISFASDWMMAFLQSTLLPSVSFITAMSFCSSCTLTENQRREWNGIYSLLHTGRGIVNILIYLFIYL